MENEMDPNGKSTLKYAVEDILGSRFKRRSIRLQNLQNTEPPELSPKLPSTSDLKHNNVNGLELYKEYDERNNCNDTTPSAGKEQPSELPKSPNQSFPMKVIKIGNESKYFKRNNNLKAANSSTCDIQNENVSKALKIISKPTPSTTDFKSLVKNNKKSPIKTYMNPRRFLEKKQTIETFALPDNPLSSQTATISLPEMDKVLDTEILDAKEITIQEFQFVDEPWFFIDLEENFNNINEIRIKADPQKHLKFGYPMQERKANKPLKRWLDTENSSIEMLDICKSKNVSKNKNKYERIINHNLTLEEHEVEIFNSSVVQNISGIKTNRLSKEVDSEFFERSFDKNKKVDFATDSPPRLLRSNSCTDLYNIEKCSQIGKLRKFNSQSDLVSGKKCYKKAIRVSKGKSKQLKVILHQLPVKSKANKSKKRQKAKIQNLDDTCSVFEDETCISDENFGFKRKSKSVANTKLIEYFQRPRKSHGNENDISTSTDCPTKTIGDIKYRISHGEGENDTKEDSTAFTECLATILPNKVSDKLSSNSTSTPNNKIVRDVIEERTIQEDEDKRKNGANKLKRNRNRSKRNVNKDNSDNSNQESKETPITRGHKGNGSNVDGIDDERETSKSAVKENNRSLTLRSRHVKTQDDPKRVEDSKEVTPSGTSRQSKKQAAKEPSNDPFVETLLDEEISAINESALKGNRNGQILTTDSISESETEDTETIRERIASKPDDNNDMRRKRTRSKTSLGEPANDSPKTTRSKTSLGQRVNGVKEDLTSIETNFDFEDVSARQLRSRKSSVSPKISKTESDFEGSLTRRKTRSKSSLACSKISKTNSDADADLEEITIQPLIIGELDSYKGIDRKVAVRKSRSRRRDNDIKLNETASPNENYPNKCRRLTRSKSNVDKRKLSTGSEVNIKGKECDKADSSSRSMRSKIRDKTDSDTEDSTILKILRKKSNITSGIENTFHNGVKDLQENVNNNLVIEKTVRKPMKIDASKIRDSLEGKLNEDEDIFGNNDDYILNEHEDEESSLEKQPLRVTRNKISVDKKIDSKINNSPKFSKRKSNINQEQTLDIKNAGSNVENDDLTKKNVCSSKVDVIEETINAIKEQQSVKQIFDDTKIRDNFSLEEKEKLVKVETEIDSMITKIDNGILNEPKDKESSLDVSPLRITRSKINVDKKIDKVGTKINVNQEDTSNNVIDVTLNVVNIDNNDSAKENVCLTKVDLVEETINVNREKQIFDESKLRNNFNLEQKEKLDKDETEINSMTTKIDEGISNETNDKDSSLDKSINENAIDDITATEEANKTQIDELNDVNFNKDILDKTSDTNNVIEHPAITETNKDTEEDTNIIEMCSDDIDYKIDSLQSTRRDSLSDDEPFSLVLRDSPWLETDMDMTFNDLQEENSTVETKTVTVAENIIIDHSIASNESIYPENRLHKTRSPSKDLDDLIKSNKSNNRTIEKRLYRTRSHSKDLNTNDNDTVTKNECLDSVEETAFIEERKIVDEENSLPKPELNDSISPENLLYRTRSYSKNVSVENNDNVDNSIMIEKRLYRTRSHSKDLNFTDNTNENDTVTNDNIDIEEPFGSMEEDRKRSSLPLPKPELNESKTRRSNRRQSVKADAVLENVNIDSELNETENITDGIKIETILNENIIINNNDDDDVNDKSTTDGLEIGPEVNVNDGVEKTKTSRSSRRQSVKVDTVVENIKMDSVTTVDDDVNDKSITRRSSSRRSLKVNKAVENIEIDTELISERLNINNGGVKRARGRPRSKSVAATQRYSSSIKDVGQMSRSSRSKSRPRKGNHSDRKRSSSVGSRKGVLKKMLNDFKKYAIPNITKPRVGEIAWAQISSHPYWPCIITKDPTFHSFTKSVKWKGRGRGTATSYYHVRFFGDRGRRAWINNKRLMKYTDRNDLARLYDSLKEIKPVTELQNFTVRKSSLNKWEKAVEEVEHVKSQNYNLKEIVRFMQTINVPTDDGQEGEHSETVISIKSKENKIKRTKKIKDALSTITNPPENPEKDANAEGVHIKKKIKLTIKPSTTSSSSQKEKTKSAIKIKKSPSSTYQKPQKEKSKATITIKPSLGTKSPKKKISISNSNSKPPDPEDQPSPVEVPVPTPALVDQDPITPEPVKVEEVVIKDEISGVEYAVNVDSIQHFGSYSLDEQRSLYKRNTLFKGVPKDKVCQFCFNFGDLYRCKGGCQGVYHLKCSVRVLIEKVPKRRKMYTPKAETTTAVERTKIDKQEHSSGNQSEVDENHVQIITVPSSVCATPPRKTFPPDVMNMTLAERIDFKMKEIMKKFESKAYLEMINESTSDEKPSNSPLMRNRSFSMCQDLFSVGSQKSPQRCILFNKELDAMDAMSKIDESSPISAKQIEESLEMILKPPFTKHVTADSPGESPISSDQALKDTEDKSKNPNRTRRSLTKHVTADFPSPPTKDKTPTSASAATAAVPTEAKKPNGARRSLLKHVTADLDSTSTETVDSESLRSNSSRQSKQSEISSEHLEACYKNINPKHFKCGFCSEDIDPYCFICHDSVSRRGSNIRQKCSLYRCSRFYHPECLKLWPQTQWSLIQTTKNRFSQEEVDSFVCPQHVCHTCASDDPRAAISRCSWDKIVKCMSCPASYHSTNLCVPAGTEIITSTQIVCPRHRNKKIFKNHTINTTWCFICNEGGNLICCETCPTSVHPECMTVNLTEDDKFICEDCESGRLPLNDEIVWVKVGHFKWWPGLIIFPNEVPPKVFNAKHSSGEFVVKFFGTYDYFWVNRGRSFLFQEGDTIDTGSNVKNKVETVFKKAVEEAVVAHKMKKQFKLALAAETASSLKPPPYIKIKVSKPVGNVRLMELNLSNTTACECDPAQPNPCGPDSSCLNRLLWTECNPEVCPAGELCKNQSFEKREYPPLVPYKTETRGWGLKTLAPIKKGTFVVEYVGELIDDEEYQRRVMKMHAQKEENYYFLTIHTNRMIDAGPKGNVARFMNHCCQPNCETQKWTVNGETRVGLFATEDIAAHMELTFNYNLECAGTEKKVCQCGAPNCSGFIGVKAKQESTEPKKPKKLKKKEPVKAIVLPPCFICQKKGNVGLCNNKICNKAYHLDCLKLDEWPEGKKYVCPWHYCNVCSKRTIRCCVKCLNSFCPSHSEGNVRYDNLMGFVCNIHEPAKPNSILTARKKRSTVTSEEGVVTSTTDDVEVIFRRKWKKSKKSSSLSSSADSTNVDGQSGSVVQSDTEESQDETVSSATASDFEDELRPRRKRKAKRKMRSSRIKILKRIKRSRKNVHQMSTANNSNRYSLNSSDSSR